MPSLWLVDGSHTIFRAYHALPHLSTRQGVPTNAVYGFTTMVLKAIREGNPTHFAVAFDEEAKAARSAIYSEYKATRGPPPDDLLPPFPLVRRLRENLLASIDKVRVGRRLIALYDQLDLPVQLEDLARKAIDEPRARQLFTELEFVRLVNDLPRPAPTPPSGARSLANTLEQVQKLVDRARAAGRFALLTLTSEDEPLRDE